MKRFSLIFLIIPVLGFSQITVTGSLFNKVTQKYLAQECFIVYNNEEVFLKVYTDSLGDFEFSLEEGGDFMFMLPPDNFSPSIYERIDNDTILNFQVQVPLAFEQACRNKFIKNNITYDLPLDEGSLEEHNRIMNKTQKLGLPLLIELKKSLIFRIWAEPAFEYGGGSISEISCNQGNWTYLFYSYNCNYQRIADTLRQINNPEVENSLLKFEITNKLDITHLIDWGKFEDNKLLSNLMSSNDFCREMLSSDWYGKMDGISFHFEIKNQENYKYICFSNSVEENASRYEQINCFMSILKSIDLIFHE